MADSPVFDRACVELERRTGLERLALRGTVRIGCRSAGLDAASIDTSQMQVLLRRVLPQELANRGVAGAADMCEAVASMLSGVAFDVTPDRAGAAASAIARFGNGS